MESVKKNAATIALVFSISCQIGALLWYGGRLTEKVDNIQEQVKEVKSDLKYHIASMPQHITKENTTK